MEQNSKDLCCTLGQGTMKEFGSMSGMLVFVLLAVLTLSGFLENLGFVFNLASQFRFQYVLGSIVCASLLLWNDRTRLAIAFVLLAFVNITCVAQMHHDFVYAGALQSHIATANASNRIRFVQLNANWRNENFDLIASYLKHSDPDILLIVELTPALCNRIRQQFPYYRFTAVNALASCNGIGLFSRMPLSDARLVDLGGDGRNEIVCRINSGSTGIQFIGTHLHGPHTKSGYRAQSAEFDAIRKYCAEVKEPLMVAGDFNSAPWISNFRRFRAALDLAPADGGALSRSTWPSEMPIAKIPLTSSHTRVPLPIIHRLIMLPLDHVLAGR